jgi:hypothetical protein
MIFQNLDQAIILIQDNQLTFKNKAMENLLSMTGIPVPGNDILKMLLFKETEDEENDNDY